MKYLIILALALTIGTAQAQDSIQRYRYSAKIYANISYAQDKNPSLTYKQLVVRPAYAFQVRNKKGNAHEFELTDLNLTVSSAFNPASTPNTYNTRWTYVMLRYEYIVNLLKHKNPKFAPAIGYAIAPYYSRQRVTPSTTAAGNYPFTTIIRGFSGLLIPRVTYNISSRSYIDVNAPIHVLHLRRDANTTMDPTVPANRRTTTLSSFDLVPFNPINLRIGLGIRF